MIRATRVMGEDHAPPCLAGINTEYRAHRHPDVEGCAAEPRAKTCSVIGELEIVSRSVADIKDYFAVFDVLPRHADTVDRSVDDDVRRMAIVDHPFVHRTYEVRSLRST